MKLPENLKQKVSIRREANALRQLPKPNSLVDFTSNDYIGFSKSASIFDKTHNFLCENNFIQNGATGSRLISGNHAIYEITENKIAQFHDAESALIFNSGYDANVGFFSCVPQRNDVIFYDELSHASIRDGITMSKAKFYKFRHNDFEDLEKLILRFRKKDVTISEVEGQSTINHQPSTIYIVTESVFSMDGDCPNMEELIVISEKYNCFLVVDEAHTLGVFGKKGEGFLQSLHLHNRVFARIITFGKGLGCHGAAVVGSSELIEFLVNFARSFIYTTGMAPHAVATILVAYQQLEIEKFTIEKLHQNIIYFNQQKKLLGIQPMFVRSKSSIQSAIIPGNENVKNIAKKFQEKGFDVKAILSPTVPDGQERLRFCIHSYNSEFEIIEVLTLLARFVFL